MSKLSPAQQEQLQNIGAYLQGIREEQGRGVDEVGNQIFIRPALVRALETADGEVLPEPVFIQGFIRRYADYLGLPGQEIASKFEPTPVAVLPDPKLAQRSQVDGVVNTQDKHGLKVISKAHSSDSAKDTGQRSGAWNWGLGLLAIAALVVGGVLAINRVPSSGPSLSDPGESDGFTAETEAAGSEGGSESASPAAAETSEAVSEIEASVNPGSEAPPISFQVNLTETSWMRVRVDGSEVYEGNLEAGTEQVWTAKSNLEVRAGNPSAVLYSFNGNEQLPMGDSGSPKTLTLTPDTDPQALQNQ